MADEGYEQQGYGMPMQMQSGILQYQLDNDEIIHDIEHTIKEEVSVPQPDGSVAWVRINPNRKPKINDAGMVSVLSSLRSRLHKVFSLSDLDEEMIEKLTLSLSWNVIDDIEQHWDVYEIRSTSDASFIVSLITDNYFALLRKAKKANYLKFLKTSAIVQEHSQIKSDMHGGIGGGSNFEEQRKTLPFMGMFGGKKR